MRDIVSISLVGLLLFGCDDTNSISGKYSGGSTTEILGGNMPVTGAVSMNAMIAQENNKITVQFQSCSIVFESHETGLANIVKNSSCTIDPEVDSGITFIINEGQANFGDDTFGMILHGVSNDDATWNFTFAGVRK